MLQVKSLELLKSCNVFERSLVCSARLHLFDQKYNKIVK